MILSSLKKNNLARKMFSLPGVSQAYHYLMALAGAFRYGFPSREITVIGITGTKGKTTAVELMAATLDAAGIKTALLSSVRIKIGDQSQSNRTSNSMPGRFFIQRFLRKAIKAGCTHAIIEVTSQGVAQGRHRFIDWDLALITNIAPEHIESHGSFENYRSAKMAFLIYAYHRGGTVFINADDERSLYFQENLPKSEFKLYSFADVQSWPPECFIGLPGKFNRHNISAVRAMALELKLSEEGIQKTLKNFEGVPGRMEFVTKNPFRAVVDYAHTPDSLEAVYSALKEDMQPGQKLICVLGSCGGGRDRWKRPVMGEIAGRYCDHIVFTDEDPYDEDPLAIMSDMAAGIADHDRADLKIDKMTDRRQALKIAIEAAASGDTVVATGKGSEYSIHLANGKVLDWNEKQILEDMLADKS